MPFRDCISRSNFSLSGIFLSNASFFCITNVVKCIVGTDQVWTIVHNYQKQMWVFTIRLGVFAGFQKFMCEFHWSFFFLLIV